MCLQAPARAKYNERGSIMYDVYFCYSDSRLNTECVDITAIEQNETQWYAYSGDEIMNHHFSLSRNFHLIGENKRYIISCKDLVSVEITKK